MTNSDELQAATSRLTLQRRAEALLAKRELARRHLLDATKMFHPNYDENWHHTLIGEHLEAVERGDIQRLMIFMPPRSGKSELVSVNFPTWFLGRNPTQEIIQTSYSSELAVDFGRKVRMHVGSQEFKHLFPDATLSEQSKASDQFRLTQGGGYLAVGVGGSITGRGGKILLLDDLHKDAKQAESGQLRDQVWQWYRGTLYTRLAPKGAIVLVMTKWHTDDIAGRILNEKESKEWMVLKFPAIAIQDEEFHGRVVRKKGDVLWPNRYPLDEVKKIEERIGPYNFAAQYQQDPVSGEAQVFHAEWWATQVTEEEVEKQQTLRFLTVDTASSLKEGSNYIGMVDNRVNSQGKWYIKARKYKMDPKEFLDTIFTLHKLHPYEWIGIEKTMFLDGFKPYLELKQDLTGVRLPIFELQHKHIAKEVRVKGLIPFFKNGTIVPIIGECNDLFPQLLRFPRSAEDDLVDALAYQPQIVTAPLGWTKEDFGGQVDSDGQPVRVKETFDPHNPLSEI